MLTKTNQIKILTEDNELLENYFRNTIITQLFVDANLVLQKFTPPVMKQFKLNLDDIGKNINDITHKFRFQSLAKYILEVIDTHVISEREIQTDDKRWYQMNIIPYVTMRDNKTNGVIVTFVDITQRIKVLKELQHEIADHEILLDTISHDIRTPLSTLLPAFQIMQELPPDNVEQIQRLLQMQSESVDKMKRLIYELTDTREQEHKYKAEEELLHFEQILEDVRLALNGNIAQSDAIIHSEWKVEEIIFPQRILRSILYNLVSNAVKYKSSDRKPVISIKTERENDFIVLSVKDNGLGIEESKQGEVFSKYYRIPGTTEGSGIGLYLVKQHIIRAGGKIVLHSEPGNGSEFKVYLKAK